jgi:hypothetical protein
MGATLAVAMVHGHRVNNVVTRWLPQRMLDRFQNHLLKYASLNPAREIEARK